MSWFKKPKYTIVKNSKKSDIPAGMFKKCERCGQVSTGKEMDDALKVCRICGHHSRMSAQDRIRLLIDEGTWSPFLSGISSADPLEFPLYSQKIESARKKTGLEEGILTGQGKINEIEVALGVTEFGFMGGSMGSVVGEEIALLIEYALEKRLPLVMICGSGGGARMHEGILSLMQMAKTTAALARLAEARIPYISVLTDPTGGGITASWALMGDINVAEPEARIFFAGERVIEQTIRQRLPKGFQRAEFLLEHGVIDQVVARGSLKDFLKQALLYLKPVEV
jgi:acetyl-CoA carboxylase carboxyl transferase subunit beta